MHLLAIFVYHELLIALYASSHQVNAQWMFSVPFVKIGNTLCLVKKSEKRRNQLFFPSSAQSEFLTGNIFVDIYKFCRRYVPA